MKTNDGENRIKIIFKTGFIGIIVNVVLAAFKMILGTLAHSIAIISDGVNNLTDAASSIITITGAALAGKPADKKHPFGYGRIEYFSSFVIAIIVLYAGVTALIEAVKNIITPGVPDYSTLTLIMVAVAVVAKLALSLYTISQGKRANSDSLTASGKEAILDAIVSFSTLVAAGAYVKFELNVEPFLAAVISILIIKTGMETLLETISKMLGEPGDYKLVIAIKKTVCEFEGVHGAYDLVMNNYGPDMDLASIHLEVDDTLPAAKLDALTRQITDEVYEKHGVYLSAIGFYSRNTLNDEIKSIEKKVAEIALSKEMVKAMHGFYVDLENKKMRFDLVISLNGKNRRNYHQKAVDAVKEAFPDYEIKVGMDIDFNELGE
ncbi:MAG: cation diffusion facilitator family transporter [Lachnospiraceae bacterium]|nr:cation diffusion facilitator family transporter [Lachnospiraceae bacterium]